MSHSGPEPGIFDANRSRAILGCVIAFTITSTVSVVLRVIAKGMKQISLCSEDWFIIAAQIAIYGMGTCSILEVVIGGAGHHVEEVPHKVTNFLKVLVAMQVFYATTLGLIKISICLFLMRIFSAANRFRMYAWIVIASATAWSILVILTAFVLCTPFAFSWDNTIPGGKCADQTAWFIAIGVLDLTVDLMILVLPMPVIWKLQLPVGNRIALLGIFCVGVFTMIISCLRIYALHKVVNADVTYTASLPVLWSFSEPAIGISVASAPLLRPLFKGRVFGSLFTSRKSTKASRKQDGDSSFQRLDEEHALSKLEPKTTISAGRTTQGSRSLSDESEEGLANDTTGITVRHELRMSRT